MTVPRSNRKTFEVQVRGEQGPRAFPESGGWSSRKPGSGTLPHPQGCDDQEGVRGHGPRRQPLRPTRRLAAGPLASLGARKWRGPGSEPRDAPAPRSSAPAPAPEAPPPRTPQGLVLLAATVVQAVGAARGFPEASRLGRAAGARGRSGARPRRRRPGSGVGALTGRAGSAVRTRGGGAVPGRRPCPGLRFLPQSS